MAFGEPKKCTSKLCRKHRPHCRFCRRPFICNCGNYPYTHRIKSGLCAHNPLSAERMYEELAKPVRVRK